MGLLTWIVRGHGHRRPARRSGPQNGWDDRLLRLVLGNRRVPQAADGGARLPAMLRVFLLAERLAQRGHDKRSLVRPGLLQYEITPLPGAELPLPGQEPVRRGERVIMLHWDNVNIGAFAATISEKQQMTFQVSQAVKQELRMLAALARSGSLPGDVRAVWAETILYPVFRRYGFCTRPAPRTLRKRLERIYFLGLLAAYGADGLARAGGGRQHHLRLGEGWISLDTLQTRFL